MYERPMDMDNRVGVDCGSWDGWGRGKQQGKNWETVTEQQQKMKERNRVTFSPYC